MSDISATVGGRPFRIRITGVLVDCRDLRTGFESQAIVEGALTHAAILADSQVRDAIWSAYYNATGRESGKYPAGGISLPEDFKIETGTS